MTVDELTAAWLAAWSGRDPDAFSALSVGSLHYEDPVTAAPLRGPSELAAHAERLWEGLPAARLEASGSVVASGKFAVIPALLSGTQTAPLGAIPATGRRLVVQCVFFCELDGEPAAGADLRLRRVRAFFDLYAAGVQLGVLPAHGTLREKALLMLQGFGLRAGGDE